jgi:amidohydrolase
MITPTTDRFAPIINEITEFRHGLHAAPELSGDEKTTSRSVRSALEAEGLEVRGFAGHQALVAVFPGRDRSRAIAVRADLDALPLQETSGKPWASRKAGIMHACGHDGHAALLVGLAKYLARHAQPYATDVHLFFQPAEESGQGAPLMIADGVLSGQAKVEAVFGLHGWPELPVGTLAVHDTAVMASVDNFEIGIKGKGAHGAMPHQGLDPVVVAAHLITAAQTLVSRRTPPLSSGVVTFAHIEAGKTYNVIPSECRLKGTVRALDSEVRKNLKQGLEQLTMQLPAAFGLTSSLEWIESTPATTNHPPMSALVKRAIAETLGTGALRSIPPSMGGEDFAYFLEQVPGAYFWLGVGDAQGLLHNPRYDFNDAAFEPALKVLTRLLELYSESSSAPPLR